MTKDHDQIKRKELFLHNMGVSLLDAAGYLAAEEYLFEHMPNPRNTYDGKTLEEVSSEVREKLLAVAYAAFTVSGMTDDQIAKLQYGQAERMLAVVKATVGE